MKNKLKYLIGVSLKRKIQTKWFAVANILLALAIVGVMNIDHIITFFGGDFDEKTKIYVIDDTQKSFDIFKTYASQGLMITEELEENEDSQYEIVLYDKTKEEAIEMLKNDENEKNNIVMVIENDEQEVIKATMITNEFTNITDFSIITSAMNQTKVILAIEKYNISEDQIAGLTGTITLNREILNEENSMEENQNMIMTTVFPVLILPFFFLTIFLVQMIGAEVNDEKSTRGMEIIIGNVSPKVHFFSKCIAGNLFILLQGALLIGYVILGFIVRGVIGGGASSGIVGELTGMLSNAFPSQFVSSLSYIIPLVLILMIVTFIGYSLLAGILASMTTNTEDFQQLQTPIMLITLVGYYLAIMAGMFKGALFIRILGYVPFISAILSPSLLVMGEFTVIDVLISIAIMIGVVYLLIHYGLRIYKVGILNYSSSGLWKKMVKALKSKN